MGRVPRRKPTVLPEDDDELEMTEMHEDLLEMETDEIFAGNNGSSMDHPSRRATQNGGSRKVDAPAPKSTSRGRWFCFILAIGVIVFVAYSNENAEVESIEETILDDNQTNKKHLTKVAHFPRERPTYEPRSKNPEPKHVTIATPAPSPKQDVPSNQGEPVFVVPEEDVGDFPKFDIKDTTATEADSWPFWKDEKEKMVEKFGKWTFFDGGAERRPKKDYCGRYPYRDIKENDFPDSAWQVDAVYVNHFLNYAGELLGRAKEAIYTEYGKGKPLSDEDLFARTKMFHIEFNDLSKKQPLRNGGAGWTTERSFNGLVRRLLHAMMTNDKFTVVLGGHSAAAGHGNHFKQSYMMQFHRVMEPIFARLGMKLISVNAAQGGLGTTQSSLGSGSIYGPDVDVIFWDSAMTERDDKAVELFARQAILGGNRSPMIFAGQAKSLVYLHENADVDVGGINGHIMDFIPETKDPEQAETIPWAARFMKCNRDSEGLCSANKFRARCWIERPDVTPKEKQGKIPSQVKWHPGFRIHQLTSRVMSMVFLEALEEAVGIWSQITINAGHPLPDEHWHMGPYIQNIWDKVANLGVEGSYYAPFKGSLTPRAFSIPIQARTEFLPRHDPEHTSLRTLIKPAKNGYIPNPGDIKMEYEGPDVYNPDLDPPEGALNVLGIVSNRRSLQEDFYELYNDQQVETPPHRRLSINESSSLLRKRELESNIEPGYGWALHDFNPGTCDGTYYQTCGRYKSNCLLYGHADKRGGIIGDCFSGWLVMEIPDVARGLIIIKIETWHHFDENKRTNGWTEVNNGWNEVETGGRRKLKRGPPPPPPPEMIMDYAVDGKITSLSWKDFNRMGHEIGANSVVWHLLDDPEWKETRPVEIAIRMRNCTNAPTMKVTHVYWS